MAHNKQNGSYGKLADLLGERPIRTFNAKEEGAEVLEYDTNEAKPGFLLAFNQNSQDEFTPAG